MKNKYIRIKPAAVIALFFVTVIFSFCTSTPAQKFHEWIYVYHKTPLQKSYIRNLVSQKKKVCITGFYLEKNGKITVEKSTTWKSIMLHKKSYEELIPLVTFKSSYHGKMILSSPSAQKQAALSLKKFILKNKYTHIHCDFEHLPPSLSKNIAKLISIIKKYNPRVTLSIAVFPQVNYRKKRSQLHDIQKIAPHLDYCVLMAYDYHDANTGPGPVTDIRWADKNVRHLLRYMNNKKIYLGMPAYGYQWTQGSKTKAVSARYAVRLKIKHNGSRHNSGCIYVKTGPRGKESIIYAADAVTRKHMLKLAEKYNLKGTALWRGGIEDSVEP